MDITSPDLIPPSRIRVLAIVGPTAVGKTAVAEKIALSLDGEIVSADSMQVYRHMDIGTAKPPVCERRVPYHCIDLTDPGEPFSAALYQQHARAAIEDIARRGKLPIVAGGTGLYVRAALDAWEFPAGEQVANPVRSRYEVLLESSGPDGLHAHLAERDPASARLIHPNNTRRVIRALEMLDGNVSYAEQHAGLADRSSIYDLCMIGLSMERPRLYERIDVRVEQMVASGLVDEVRQLLDAGFADALTAAQAIGYKELVDVARQGTSLDEAVEQIQRATRRYAKRQLTWFRGDRRVRWIDVTDLSPQQAASRTMAAIDWTGMRPAPQ